MPELPEVETFVRQLRPLVLNRKIKGFKVNIGGERLIGKQDRTLLHKYLTNDSIIDIRRHGKYIIFQLKSTNRIVAHLRMTGRFIFSKEPLINKFNRIYVEFADGTYLNFVDIRKFATFDFQLSKDFVDKNSIAKIGPDATSPLFDFDYLKSYARKSKRVTYTALLDQKLVAGIGNIYANEALYNSKIHPKRLFNSLTDKELKTLVINIKSILENAIAFRGTTLIDNSYRDIEGNSGEFSRSLKVYARVGKPCPRCKSEIKRLRLTQRSVFYCPHCQEL